MFADMLIDRVRAVASVGMRMVLNKLTKLMNVDLRVSVNNGWGIDEMSYGKSPATPEREFFIVHWDKS